MHRSNRFSTPVDQARREFRHRGRRRIKGFCRGFHESRFRRSEFRRPVAQARFDSTASVARIKTSLVTNGDRRGEDAPEVTKDDMEIVSTVRTALADKVGQERFDLWFGAATRLNYDGRALSIGAPSEFFLEWIRTNFRRHIEMACSDALGHCPAIEFHLDAATTRGDERTDASGPGARGGARARGLARGWRRSSPRPRPPIAVARPHLRGPASGWARETPLRQPR